MFDLAQLGMPTEVTVDGERWLDVYRVGDTSDGCVMYLAIKPDDAGRFVAPAPCWLIKATATRKAGGG